MGGSESVSVGDQNVFKYLIGQFNNASVEEDGKERWFVILINNPTLKTIFCQSIQWPPNKRQLVCEAKEEANNKPKPCVKCGSEYTENKKLNYSCHFHPSRFLETEGPFERAVFSSKEEVIDHLYFKDLNLDAAKYCCCLRNVDSQGCGTGFHSSDAIAWNEELERQDEKYKRRAQGLGFKID
jgi:hypothetical protein